MAAATDGAPNTSALTSVFRREPLSRESASTIWKPLDSQPFRQPLRDLGSAVVKELPSYRRLAGRIPKAAIRKVSASAHRSPPLTVARFAEQLDFKRKSANTTRETLVSWIR